MKIAVALVLAFAVSGAAQAADPLTPPSVPPIVKVPPAYKPFLLGHAVGTQNYICAPAATNTGVDWLFIGPQATLFNADGQQILTHFQSTNPFESDPSKAIQATWQHSNDSSAVWAKKLYGSTDPNYVRPDAIEWLLLT
ncbi:MAG: hypothetical protein C5B57_12225, partial [Blastocatellia bacterium]